MFKQFVLGVFLAIAAYGSWAGAENEYAQAMRALDQKRWEEALAGFRKVVAERSARVDAALYWSAYTQNKLGRREEALRTITQLKREFAASRWVNDAKALEVEVLAAAGRPVPPEQTSDDDLKLMALNGLMQSDPERATAIVEKMLAGTSSPKVKQRALFVLAQSNTPKARETLLRLARNSSNPELQRQALRNLAVFQGKESGALLEEIYRTSNNTALRREVLRGFMLTGNRARVLEIAKNEKDTDLRREALRQLGVMGGQKELLELYPAITDEATRKELMGGLMIAGAVEPLAQIARTDRSTASRIQAVQMLGVMGKARTSDVLLDIYHKDPEAEVRKAVVRGLFTQGNAKALVEIARTEKDAALKQEAVRVLSIMKAPEARELMLEILEK